MFYWTAFLLLISFLPYSVLASADLVWHEYEGRCYTVPTPSLPFNNAKQTCTNIGTELVEIDTEEELRFIQSVLSGTSNQYWVGIEYNGTDYHWMQTQKSPPPYMWLLDEPNASGTCVRLLTEAMLHTTSTAPNKDEFLLGDHNCNMTYKIMCEKDSGPHHEQAYTLVPKPSKYQCPMKSFTARSRVQCGRACAVDSICLGFQYDHLTRDCILTEFASACSTSLSSNLSTYTMNVPRC